MTSFVFQGVLCGFAATIGQSELEITEMFEFKMVGRYIILITDGLLRNREE
jgi:hypothetical protein